MSSEAMMELTNKAESIDPSSIGLQSGTYPALTEVDVRAIDQQVRILTAAQALLQVINTTPGGLVLRDIYVQYDFVDGAGVKITNNDWRQPWAGAGTPNYSTETGNFEADAATVYKTSITSDYNRKVVTIYGFEIVNVGNARGYKALASNAILFKRGNVKLIDIIDLQSIDTRDPPMLILRTPIMYKAADVANIMHSPNGRDTADANKFDTLKYVGITCETLGSSQTG